MFQARNLTLLFCFPHVFIKMEPAVQVYILLAYQSLQKELSLLHLEKILGRSLIQLQICLIMTNRESCLQWCREIRVHFFPSCQEVQR